jgi:hypothetical protein
MDLYADKVKLVHYVLVFDATPIGEDVRTRTVLTFETKEALVEEMNEVAKYFN